MVSGKVPSSLLLLVMYVATGYTDAFGGRSKNFAHVFGKRAENGKQDRGFPTYDSKFDIAYQYPRLQTLNSLLNVRPDVDNENTELPLDAQDYNYMFENDFDQREWNRLSDILENSKSNYRGRQGLMKYFGKFILDKLAQYKK